MKKFLTILLFITAFTVQGWGANSCTGATTVTLMPPTTTVTGSANATGTTYYFAADGPGTVTITITTANNMALNASTTACPTNVGGTTTQTLTLTAADKDFNVRVYRTNGSGTNASFTLTVTFTRDCSPYKGQVMLNELRIGSTTTTSIANQIELYNSGNIAESIWRTWKLVMYYKNSSGTISAKGPYSLSSTTQFTANGQFIYNSNLAIYLRDRNGRSVDVALVDANGALIDYVAIESVIQNVSSCFGTPSVVNATPSSNSIGDIARLPDGGTWPSSVTITNSHTISRTNVCSIGSDLVVTNSADTLNPIINTSLVTYTVNVLNKSCSNTINSITLTDTNISTTYFNGLAYTPSVGSTTQGAGAVTWSIGNLTAGASATLTIKGTPKVLGLIPSTAAITAPTSGLVNTGDDSDTETINVRDYNYVGFDLNTATLTEGTDLTYSASISSNLLATKPITVNYTVSGTAGSGDTNLSASGSVIIDPTDPETPQQTTINFSITDDTVSEPIKSINFTITSVTSLDPSVRLDTTSQDMNITLLDDDDPIIADYRFDECSETASIIDSSGNGNDMTGGVGITGGKLCNAKTFNGSTQYITLPSAISTQLQTTASLSFWIKTTQIGDNTMWLAPGITGVEQAGGGNDVFWGWLDASGHIGILKGNTAGAKSTNSINNDTWNHIVLTRDSSNGSVQVYVNGVLNQTATSESGDVTTAFSRLGSIEDTGGTPTYFNGSLDEVKVFRRVLTSDEVTAIYTNDATLVNYDGSVRTCQVCVTNCTSFSYQLYHPMSINNKLQTRISQQAFDLNATVACTSGTGAIPSRKIKNIYAVSGTCPVATTGLPVLWSGLADINDTIKTITLSNLNSTKAYSNIKLMLETNASELNCSTDNFAIRPPSFNITSPLTSVAANTFTLQLSALNSGGGYNGTANVTTALQTPNANCPTASSFLKSSLGAIEPLSILFQSDSNSSQMKATDVGGIYLNVKDSNWTIIDQPASECVAGSNSTILNGQGLVGCNIDNNLSLTIKPDHFDLNATLSNAVTGFTYLSTDLNMSAQLDLNITAKTADGNTTKNYNTGCYAKQTNYTISYTAPSITPSANLTKLNYLETNTSTSGNVATTANAFTLTALPKTIFGSDTNGSAKLSVKINFDRSNSLPVNPFDLNITSAVATDTDSVTGNDTTVGNASFVYGRTHAYDVTTNQTSNVPNPIEIEVYGKNSSHLFLNNKFQNVLYWYRNTDHDNALAGSILSGNAYDTNVTVTTNNPPLNGIQSILLSYSKTIPITRTVHLTIPAWLWYSPSGKTYLSTGTDCTTHPCFKYNYTDTSISSVKGVSSGTFGGTDFTMTPANNIIKKGVKVFR